MVGMTSEARLAAYQNAFLHHHAGGLYVCSLGQNWQMIHANPALCRLLDVDEESFFGDMGAVFTRFIHPDDVDSYVLFAQGLSATEETDSISYRLVLKDGSEMTVLDTMVSKRQKDGSMLGYSILADISHLQYASFKRTDESLDNLLSFSENVFDILLRIDVLKKSMICVKNNQVDVLNVPLNLPLYAPDIVELWSDVFVVEDDIDEVRQFADIESLSPNEIRHSNFRTKDEFGGRIVDALFLNHGEEAVVIIKIQQRDDRVSDQPNAEAGVFIRTFGHFDVFVDGVPIPFKNAKAKEYLALLVDRRGGFVSSREAVVCLWEDERVDDVALARARKAAMFMNNTLKEFGVEDIVENTGSSRRIDLRKVKCDLIDYLQGENNQHLFKGSYMREYSWAEETLAELTFSMAH